MLDPSNHTPAPTVAILHGAGYVGGELIQLLHTHPSVELVAVTSRTFAGQPVHSAHPFLRGQVDLLFSAPEASELSEADVLVVAAEHGKSMHLVPEILEQGFTGKIVDLSADFRLDEKAYQKWYGGEHAAPELLPDFAYGLPEIYAPYAPDASYVANPGCFATGLSLALAPLAQQISSLDVHVTAYTGASGSGASPSAATHFPDRDGNVRAYNVLTHRHTAEVSNVVGDALNLSFVPVSGPWTRGIWGTAQFTWPYPVTEADIAAWYEDAYGDSPLVRCTEGVLPELRPVVGTPFADLGWVLNGSSLVVGFALDNLMKGAASQAVQNLNLLLGLPETAGLLAQTAHSKTPLPVAS